MARRYAADLFQRAVTRPSLPPRRLLANIQLTPFVTEYVRVGRRSAQNILAAAERYGIARGAAIDLLDFGCGSARLLRHLGSTSWRLNGCDIDRPAIEWAAANIPFAQFRVNGERPPLPYETASFDVVVAVSLFTHFAPDAQRAWIAELARVVRPNGLVIISTMGSNVIGNFPAHATTENVLTLLDRGSIYADSGDTFNSRAAFHTARGVTELAGETLELLSWQEHGLDGFQDLSVLRRRAGDLSS